MPDKMYLWIKTMVTRTRNRVVNLPPIVRGLLFHARLAATPRRGPRFFIERWAGIGDIICMEPSLRELRARHPDALIVFSTPTEYIPLMRMIKGVDVFLDSRGLDHYRFLAKRLYDMVVHPRCQDEVYEIVNHPSYKGNLRPPQSRIHLIDDFARDLGVTPTDRQPRLHVPPAVLERLRPQVEALRRGDGPLIAIQPGPSEPVRMWPEAHWEALMARLTDEMGAVVIQMGADFHNFSRKEKKAYRLPGAHDWVNRLDLVETAAALSLCDGFIGIDSGLLHMAGAVRTPGVGLFGPVEPTMRLAPTTPALAVTASPVDVPCLGCHHLEPRLHWRTGCPFDIACMRELAPDAVFDAAHALLCREEHS